MSTCTRAERRGVIGQSPKVGVAAHSLRMHSRARRNARAQPVPDRRPIRPVAGRSGRSRSVFHSRSSTFSHPASHLGRPVRRRYYRRLPLSGRDSGTRCMNTLGRLLAFTTTVAVLFTGRLPVGQAQGTADNRLAARVDPYVEKQRVIVMTDIANEPDDQMSMVRFLVYSNQFDVEGLIATTSTWMKNKVRPDVI